MSIETTAGFFYGWMLTYDEVRDLTLKYHIATDQAGNIEDCFTPLDACRDPYNTMWLFGTWIAYFPEPGHWRVFNPSDMLELPDQEWYDEMTGMMKLAGCEDIYLHTPPKVYCVHQIW